MSYIKKHRPLISYRIKFRPSPYPPRALITQRIIFSDEQLQHSARRDGRGNEEMLSELNMESSQRVRRQTPVPSDDRLGHRQDNQGNRRGQTPVQQNEEGQRSRRVTIQEFSPEIADGGPSTARLGFRRSGTMRLRSAPPETRSSSLIKKPQGEPGRPNAGGHNVEVELIKQQWSKSQYNALYEAVKAQASEKLDMSRSFRFQKQEIVKLICEMLTDNSQWPTLECYEECWPVRNILKMVLKTGTDAHKRAQARRVIDAVASHGRGLPI